MSKQLNTRIQHKIDTKENWANATFAPLKGELIVYQNGRNGSSNIPDIKIGDGTTPINNLEFVAPVKGVKVNSKEITPDANGVVSLSQPDKLPNPQALTLQGNGVTLTNGIYDGKESKTVNITYSSVGAAPASHEQSANTITAGTFKGEVKASTVGELSTRKIRNISMGTQNIGVGAALEPGSVYIQYTT